MLIQNVIWSALCFPSKHNFLHTGLHISEVYESKQKIEKNKKHLYKYMRQNFVSFSTALIIPQIYLLNFLWGPTPLLETPGLNYRTVLYFTCHGSIFTFLYWNLILSLSTSSTSAPELSSCCHCKRLSHISITDSRSHKSFSLGGNLIALASD